MLGGQDGAGGYLSLVGPRKRARVCGGEAAGAGGARDGDGPWARRLGAGHPDHRHRSPAPRGGLPRAAGGEQRLVPVRIHVADRAEPALAGWRARRGRPGGGPGAGGGRSCRAPAAARLLAGRLLDARVRGSEPPPLRRDRRPQRRADRSAGVEPRPPGFPGRNSSLPGLQRRRPPTLAVVCTGGLPSPARSSPRGRTPSRRRTDASSAAARHRAGERLPTPAPGTRARARHAPRAARRAAAARAHRNVRAATRPRRARRRCPAGPTHRCQGRGGGGVSAT